MAPRAKPHNPSALAHNDLRLALQLHLPPLVALATIPHAGQRRRREMKADRVVKLRAVKPRAFDDPPARGTTEAALGERALEIQHDAFQLRRETVAAVVRQQQLRQDAFAARELADAVEQRACRALEQGDPVRARQILARDMYVLKTCEALEERLAQANRSVAELLRRLVRTEDAARLAFRRKEELAKGGRGC